MATILGQFLRQLRTKRGLKLRDVERATGVHNAHLSQIENGIIEKPDPNILWTLSRLYRADFRRLMTMAGHTSRGQGGQKSPLMGVAFRALEQLTPAQQQHVIQYIEKLREKQLSKEDLAK